MPDPLPTRERPRDAAGQILERLRAAILALELPPGTVLSRAELQARFGVSSTPLRDALLRLAEEGLVEIFPQHATRVSRIDLAAAQQAQFLRRSIELEIVGTLAETPAGPATRRLRAIVAQQAVLAELGELEELDRLDLEFHRTLYEAAGVPDLWDLVRRRSGAIDRLRRLHLPVEGKAEEIVADHGLILEAIAAGRPEPARQALRAHLSRSLAYSAAMRLGHPDYFRD